MPPTGVVAAATAARQRYPGCQGLTDNKVKGTPDLQAGKEVCATAYVPQRTGDAVAHACRSLGLAGQSALLTHITPYLEGLARGETTAHAAPAPVVTAVRLPDPEILPDALPAAVVPVLPVLPAIPPRPPPRLLLSLPQGLRTLCHVLNTSPH